MPGSTQVPRAEWTPDDGWYIDPGDPTRWRYWDDGAWTEWVSGEDQQPRVGARAKPFWAPPIPRPTRPSRSRNLANTSIAISVGTLFFFLDLFALFTAPVSIVLGLVARGKAASGSSDRTRANVAIGLGVATLALWPLLIPMYNAMDAGL
jgi:hypothetical protein